MIKFASTSSINQNEWSLIISSLSLLKKNKLPLNFSKEEIWHGLPVGQYLDTIQNLYCRHLITKEQNEDIKKLGLRRNKELNYYEKRWNYMYDQAKAFFDKHGHLNIPSKKNKHLYYWVEDQRKKFKKFNKKRPTGLMYSYMPLSDEQIEKLKAIGIYWNYEDKYWDDFYTEILKFYKIMGHSNVWPGFSINGINLYSRCQAIRKGRLKLTPQQIKQLEEVNFNMKLTLKTGTSFFEQATFYYFSTWFDGKNRYKIDGVELDIYIPLANIAIEYDGVFWHRNKLQNDNEKDNFCKSRNIKLIRIREHGLPKTNSSINYFLPQKINSKTFDSVIKKIIEEEPLFRGLLYDVDTEAHAMDILAQYKNIEETTFEIHFKELKDYLEQHHRFPQSNKSHSGLYGWMLGLRQIRRGCAYGFLSSEQIERLNQIRFPWNPKQSSWEKGLEHAALYYKTYGNLNVPEKYKDPYDSYRLGSWLVHQRQRGPYGTSYGGTPLTSDQIKQLTELGMVWECKSTMTDKEKVFVVEIKNTIFLFLSFNYSCTMQYFLNIFSDIKESIVRKTVRMMVNQKGVKLVNNGLNKFYTL